MKRLLLFLSLLALSFRTDKTASLQFTKDQYQGVQSRLIDAMKVIDSLKIVLHYKDAGDKTDQSAIRAQQGLVDVYNFIGQVDTVFKVAAEGTKSSSK